MIHFQRRKCYRSDQLQPPLKNPRGGRHHHAVDSDELRTWTRKISVGQVSCNWPCVNAKRTCLGRFAWRYVTDRHFGAYHITSIRILITGRPFRSGIARAHAPGRRISDLITGAEQSVVRTGGIIRRVHTFIVDSISRYPRYSRRRHRSQPAYSLGRCR